MTQPRLIVVGDSFTVDPMETQDTTMTWLRQTAERMGMTLWNFSQHGVAQDWCFQQLRPGFSSAEDAITAEDRIIVVLTHPNRFWFFQDKPNLSNSHIMSMEQHVSKDQNRAVEGFFRHIQRPELDTLQMIMRLGWLAGHVSRLGLAKPLVIRAFGMNVQEAELYPELAWAEGTLFDIQVDECWNNLELIGKYFKGVDCRYNHMSLRNHKVLADKIVDYFENNSPLNLTTGFHKEFIQANSIQDPEFCSQELNLYRLKDMQCGPGF